MSERLVETVFLATRTAHEDFTRSHVWADMLNELKEWEADVRAAYDTCSDLQILGLIQGRLEAIEHLRTLPERIIEALRQPTRTKIDPVIEED